MNYYFLVNWHELLALNKHFFSNRCSIFRFIVLHYYFRKHIPNIIISTIIIIFANAKLYYDYYFIYCYNTLTLLLLYKESNHDDTLETIKAHDTKCLLQITNLSIS